MNSLRRKSPGAALALSLVALAGCESGNYGGSSSVSYGYGYYPGGYYPGYYPGECCWDNDVIVSATRRPENRPDGRRRCRRDPANSARVRASRRHTPAPSSPQRQRQLRTGRRRADGWRLRRVI
jgi:hypothetical protein